MEPNQEQIQNLQNLKKINTKSIIIIVSIILLVALGGGYYYLSFKKEKNIMDTNQTQNNQEDLKEQASFAKIPDNLNLFTEVKGGKKEEYIVNINGLNVNVKILINGIPFFYEDMNASESIPGLPLSSFLTNGDNKVEIEVSSIVNEYKNNDCNLKFGHVYLDISNDIIYDKEFNCGEILKNKGIENFTYNIKTNLPFISPWLNGKKFENTKEAREELLSKYKYMQNIFVSLDYEKIKDFLKYKFTMDSEYLYEEKESVESRYIASIKKEFENPNLVLLPVIEEHSGDIKLEISNDGYLARLIVVDGNSVSSPLMWYDTKEKTTLTYPLWFMMTIEGYIIPIL